MDESEYFTDVTDLTRPDSSDSPDSSNSSDSSDSPDSSTSFSKAPLSYLLQICWYLRPLCISFIYVEKYRCYSWETILSFKKCYTNKSCAVGRVTVTVVFDWTSLCSRLCAYVPLRLSHVSVEKLLSSVCVCVSADLTNFVYILLGIIVPMVIVIAVCVVRWVCAASRWRKQQCDAHCLSDCRQYCVSSSRCVK